MKYVIAAAAVLAATSASAADLGMGLTAGGEAVAEYNVDAENMLVTLEPTIGYTIAPVNVDLTASSLINIYNDEFVLGDAMPTLDFEARKALVGNIEIYAGTGYDLELEERTDIKIGVSFNF
jgi:opacity protein-like surface antigen